jgi:hypothetical protein
MVGPVLRGPEQVDVPEEEAAVPGGCRETMDQ